MTQNTTADFSDTLERQAANVLAEQLTQIMHSKDYELITDEHHEALDFLRNERVQMLLKQTDGGKA